MQGARGAWCREPVVRLTGGYGDLATSKEKVDSFTYLTLAHSFTTYRSVWLNAYQLFNILINQSINLSINQFISLFLSLKG